MKVYNYERKTGIYTGISEADPDPMNPDQYLIPAYSTHKKPPEQPAGKVAKFNREASRWTLIDKPVAEEEAVPVLTHDQKVAVWQTVVNEYADDMARAFRFKDLAEAISYADEPEVPEYQQEGKAFRAWRSKLRFALDTATSRIAAGLMEPFGTPEDLIAAMPPFERPDVRELLSTRAEPQGRPEQMPTPEELAEAAADAHAAALAALAATQSQSQPE